MNSRDGNEGSTPYHTVGYFSPCYIHVGMSAPILPAVATLASQTCGQAFQPAGPQYAPIAHGKAYSKRLCMKSAMVAELLLRYDLFP